MLLITTTAQPRNSSSSIFPVYDLSTGVACLKLAYFGFCVLYLYCLAVLLHSDLKLGFESDIQAGDSAAGELLVHEQAGEAAHGADQ